MSNVNQEVENGLGFTFPSVKSSIVHTYSYLFPYDLLGSNKKRYVNDNET